MVVCSANGGRCEGKEQRDLATRAGQDLLGREGTFETFGNVQTSFADGRAAPVRLSGGEIDQRRTPT